MVAGGAREAQSESVLITRDESMHVHRVSALLETTLESANHAAAELCATPSRRFAQWWHHTPENRNKCEVCVSCPGLSFTEPVDHPGLPENLHSYWCSENRSHTGLPVTEVNIDCSVLLFVSRREPGKSQRNPRCEISQNQNTLLITVCGWGGGINENINMI